jgi:hypothetical protein
MRRTRSVMSWLAIAVFAAVGVVLLGIFIFGALPGTSQRTPLETPYQAILLSNGQAYYGKLQALGSPYPVLTDVHYVVQRLVNQERKEVANVLVKRGKEWHAPDRMILNAAHIVFVEPVRQDSELGRMITASKDSQSPPRPE